MHIALDIILNMVCFFLSASTEKWQDSGAHRGASERPDIWSAAASEGKTCSKLTRLSLFCHVSN